MMLDPQEPIADPTLARQQRPAWQRTLVFLLPYAITATILFALFQRYSLEEVWSEAHQGPILPLIPLALIAMILSLVIAAGADTLVIRGCCGTPTFGDIFRAKAGSSLIDILGYAAGHSGYAVWIARFSGVGAGLAAGIMVFIAASDLTAVCLAASISIGTAGGAVANPTLTWLAPVLGGSLLLTMLGIPLLLTPTTSKTSFLSPWALLPRRKFLAQIGLRMFQLVIWIVSTSLAAHLFGLQIPLAAFATFLPIVLLVASLPINVAGFGAVQAVWVHFFQDHDSPERVLAFQFVWQLLILGSVILRGLPFIRRVITEIDRGSLPIAETRP